MSAHHLVYLGNLLWGAFLALGLFGVTVEASQGVPLQRMAPMLAQASPSDWTGVIKEVGVMGAVLIAVAYAIARITVWISKELVLPLRDKVISRLMGFLDKLETAILEVNRTAADEKALLALADKRREEVWGEIFKRLDKSDLTHDELRGLLMNWHKVCSGFHDEVRGKIFSFPNGTQEDTKEQDGHKTSPESDR